MPAGLFAALASTMGDVAAGHPVRLALDWVPVLGLEFAFVVDGLALVFALLITGIGTFIVLYSARLPRRTRASGPLPGLHAPVHGRDAGARPLRQPRCAIRVLGTRPSVTSFLLIGFDHEREKARRGAIQALVVTGVGGLALMAGGVLLHAITGTWTISELASSLHRAGSAVALPGGSRSRPRRGVHEIGAVAIPLLAAQRDGSADARVGLSSLGDDGAGRRVSAGAPVAAARRHALLADPALHDRGDHIAVGGIVALRQTDLKQILAQTTIASLGLSVLLLGIGGAAAAMAVATYFVAHALYKAALFMLAGIIDHGDGHARHHKAWRTARRPDHQLHLYGAGGVLDVRHAAAGWLSRQRRDLCGARATATRGAVVTIVVMVLGNALLGAVALVLTIRPFMGPLETYA